MKQYVLVSQGIEIFRSSDKLEAESIMRESNENYEKYYQECLDNGECPADNEIFLHEETEIFRRLRLLEQMSDSVEETDRDNAVLYDDELN